MRPVYAGKVKRRSVISQYISGIGVIQKKRQKLGRNLHANLLIFLVYLINFLVTPQKISFDGYLYLASAKSLFTSDFSLYYHFMREPLYPLIIRTCLEIGGIWTLFLLQSFLLMISSYLLLRITESLLGSPLKFIPSTAIVVGSFLTVRGYAVALLQQALFIFLVCFFLYHMTKRSIRGLPSDSNTRPRIDFQLIIILVLSFYTFVQLGVMLSLSSIAISLFRGNRKVLILRLLVSVLIAIILFVPWLFVKKQFDTGREVFKSLDVKTFFFEQNRNLGQARLDTLTQSIFATFGLSPEINTQSMPLSFEARTYGMPVYVSENGCSSRDPGNQATLDFIQDEIAADDCKNDMQIEFSNFLSVIARVMSPFLNLVAFSFLVSSLFISVSVLRPIAITMFFLIVPYIAAGYGISRYGATFFFFAPLIVFIFPKFQFSRTIRFSGK